MPPRWRWPWKNLAPLRNKPSIRPCANCRRCAASKPPRWSSPMPRAPLCKIAAICWVAAARAARRLFEYSNRILGVADFVESIPTRIRPLEFSGEGVQALQRFTALVFVTLEHLGIADQSVQLRLFRFELLNLFGQLLKLPLLIV